MRMSENVGHKVDNAITERKRRFQVKNAFTERKYLFMSETALTERKHTTNRRNRFYVTKMSAAKAKTRLQNENVAR